MRGNDVRAPRTGALYNIDKQSAVRRAHENSQIQALYADYLGGKPCEGLAYKLLHTRHFVDRSQHLTAKR